MNRSRSKGKRSDAKSAPSNVKQERMASTQINPFSAAHDPCEAVNPSGLAGIRVINASPDTVANVFINGDHCFYDVSYGQLTAYARVTPGFRSLRTLVRDANGRESELETTLSLHSDSEYTVAVVGDFPELEQIVVKDTTAPPKQGRIRIRFWNLAPGIGPVDMLTGDGVDIFRNVDYKEVTGFAEINAGKADLHFRRAGQGSDIGTVEGLVLEPTGRYTFILLAKRGLEGPFNVVPVRDPFGATKVLAH